MKKQHTNYLFYFRNAKAIFAFIVLLFGFSNSIWSQTIVYSNDFNANETVLTIAGSPAMTWTNVTTGIGIARTAQFGVASNYLLQIRNNPTKDATGSSNIGRTFVYGDLSNFANPFQKTLNSNLSDVTWTFNIRSGRNSASLSFDDGQYASAVVLCANGSNFLTASGYAVTLMKGTSYNAIRLVKFSGGLTSNSNITTIIGPSLIESSNTYTDYFSVKVVYSPATNRWKLFSRLDGASISVDPESGTLTQVGSEAIDNTYTGSVMSNFGFFFNHGSTGYYVTYFDNFKVKLNNLQAVSSNNSLSSLGLTEVQLANSDFRINSGEFIVNQNATVNSVLVSPGAKLTLNDGALLTTGSLILKNTVSGTASFVDSRAVDSPAAIAGTVEQAVTETNRNWYVAVPVSGKSASDITLSGAYIVKRNETGVGSWDNVVGSLTAGVGYVAVASATGGITTWYLNGNLNSGKVEVPVTRSGSSATGFNLLGNPYPSYLNWEQVLNLNVTNASLLQSSIWYRTATFNVEQNKYNYTFNTYNSAGRVATPITTSGYIPPMQAFWVRANSAGTVTFTNAMRSHGDGESNKLKAPSVNTQKIIRLQVSNTVATDETVVYLDPNAQNNFDKYDTEKMFNNVASQPELYTKANNEKLVINGLNQLQDNLELPLGLTYVQGGNLKLKITELSNFDSNTKVYLRDKVDVAEIELAPETEYTFNTDPTNSNESRFSLLFKAPEVTTGSENPYKEEVSVFVNAVNQITIIAPEKTNYSIYNAVGQKLNDGITKSNHSTLNFNLQAGIYVVKINSYSTRVIIK